MEKVKHITELDDITLCLEWTKLREENNRLYEINNRGKQRMAWFHPKIDRGLTCQIKGLSLHNVSY